MVTVCAWCERFMGLKEPAGHQVTHGICANCLERQRWDVEPVLVVSRDRSSLAPVLQNLLRGVPRVRVIVERRERDRRVAHERRRRGVAERREEPNRRQADPLELV